MSIRLVALEFYKAKKRIEELDKQLEGMALNDPARSGLEAELRSARAEESRLKAMLDGAKA